MAGVLRGSKGAAAGRRRVRFCGCKDAFRRCPLANADTGQIFACHCKPVMGLSGLSRLSNEKNPGKSPAREKHTLTFSRKIDKITTYREAVRLRGFPAGSGPSPIAPPAATPDNKIRRNSL